MTSSPFNLMLVTRLFPHSIDEYLTFISSCAVAGITAVQLREKNRPYAEIVSFARHLQTCLKPHHIPLIVNDNLALALEIGADGVHLGQSDGDVMDARNRLGPDKIIGLTVNTLSQLELANSLPIDYIGVGAIFPTLNKPNVQTIWGTSGLTQAVLLSKHPVIAIGGIDEHNAPQVMETGASGIAAIGVFHNSNDPALTTHVLKHIVDGAQHYD